MRDLSVMSKIVLEYLESAYMYMVKIKSPTIYFLIANA